MPEVTIHEPIGTPRPPAPRAPEKIPEESDPRRFFERFRTSPIYRKTFSSYLADPRRPGLKNLTEAEQKEHFEGTENARDSLYSFAQNNLIFKWVPEMFPPDARDAIFLHFDVTKGIQMGYAENSSENRLAQVIDREQAKTNTHTLAAQTLYRTGVAPSLQFGKELVRLIRISAGIGGETFGSASETEFSRLRRSLVGAAA